MMSSMVETEDVENVIGGSGADAFVGNSLDNQFVVSGGEDKLVVQ